MPNPDIARVHAELANGLAEEAELVRIFLDAHDVLDAAVVSELVRYNHFRALVARNHGRRQFLDGLPKGD